mgnify:FL=1
MKSITIFLHGKLRAFLPRAKLEAGSAHQALHGLSCQLSGFEEAVSQMQLRLISGSRKGGKILNGAACFAPLGHRHLHVVPVIAGRGRDNGKIALGLTLVGLSFVPGVSGSIAARFAQAGSQFGGAEFGQLGHFLGSQLLGSAGAFLMQAGLSEQAGSQHRNPAGQLPSALISTPASSAEGQPVPLIYGRVRLTAPPIISSSLIVETEAL